MTSTRDPYAPLKERAWREVADRSERLNLRKPQVDYRVLWVDSDSRPSPISEEGS